MPNTNQIEDWLQWMQRVRHARTATINTYELSMTKFASWVETRHPNVSWTTMTADIIEEWMLRERRGGIIGAPATQSRDLSCIQSFYKYLKMRGVITRDPTVDVPIPNVSNRKPKAISDDVWRKFWLSDLPPEDRAWIGLGAFAGLRRREIVSLAPEQVSVDRGLLYGVARKGGAEDVVEYVEMATIIHQRLPHVLPDLDDWLEQVAELAAFREGERTFITMDWPATETSARANSLYDDRLPSPVVLNKRLIKLLRWANLPENTFTPHSLRHTAATNLLRCGLPIEVVADCLGHSSPNITMRYSKTAGRLAEWRNRIG